MTQNLAASLTIEALRADIDTFSRKIDQLASLLGLDFSQLQADHIAMRVNHADDAKRLHQDWQGETLSQAMINGRPIVVLKLTQGFELNLSGAQQYIDVLELPYPSEKTYPVEGWEHVEFVLPCQARTTDELLDALFEQFPNFEQTYATLADLGVKVKASSPKGEGERLANPTLAFKYQNVCIKIHPHTLEAVIDSERD